MTWGYRRRSAWQTPPLQKNGSKAAAVRKRKRLDWSRGALFYTKKCTTLMFALSSKKCAIRKLLSGRTLADHQ